MTENDAQLIQQAKNTHCQDFLAIGKLAEKASSPEARHRILEIQKMKYHLDEYSNHSL